MSEPEIIRFCIVDDDGEELPQEEFLSNIKVEIVDSDDEGNQQPDYSATEFQNYENFIKSEKEIKQEVLSEDEEVYQLEAEPVSLEEVLLFNIENNDDNDTENDSQNESEEDFMQNKSTRVHKTFHSCGECGYLTPQKSHYKRHIKIHNRSKEIRCGICNKLFETRRELSEHTNLHRKDGDPTKFVCNICPYFSNKLTNVHQHMVVHQKQQEITFSCEICKFKSKNAETIRVHQRKHRNRVLSCGICNKVFESITLLRKHVKTYRDPESLRYKCPECPYSAYKFYNVKMHMVIHRNEYEIEMLPCPHCPFRAKRKTDLTQHVIVKHLSEQEVNMLDCDFCSYRSRRGTHLTSHMKNIHKEELKIKKCFLCAYKTVSKCLYKRHLKIHNYNIPRTFLCSFCGIGYSKRLYLDQHIKSAHHNAKNSKSKDSAVKFDENTEESADDPDDPAKSSQATKQTKTRVLDDIVIKKELCSDDVSGDMVVYRCEYCDFMSENQKTVTLHIILVHSKPGEDHKCTECTFHTTSRFIYVDHLKLHNINVENLKPHLCDICGSRWLRQGDLTKHMALHWGHGRQKRRKRTHDSSDDSGDDLPPRKKKSATVLFQCCICEYKTKRRLCLFKHMKTHGEEYQENFKSLISDDSE